jgi:hypothetical protein
MSIVMMMATAAVVGSGQTPRAQNQNISAFNTSASNSRAGFSVQRDGDILRRQGGSNADVGDYVGSGLPDANIGLLYEVRVIQSSGNTLTNSAGLNVFLQINGTLTWDFNDAPGQFKSFNGTYEVREIADPSNTSGTATLSFETEDGS